MLMPSIFGENLFDDFFGDFPFYYDDRAMKDAEKKLYGHKANHVMKTDIKEMNNGYELIVDLPGFKKDEVHAALENALKGRTSIVIAHRLSTVRDADQILVLENGSIVERGKHEELVALGGLYADLYNRQDLTGSSY